MTIKLTTVTNATSLGVARNYREELQALYSDLHWFSFAPEAVDLDVNGKITSARDDWLSVGGSLALTPVGEGATLLEKTNFGFSGARFHSDATDGVLTLEDAPTQITVALTYNLVNPSAVSTIFGGGSNTFNLYFSGGTLIHRCQDSNGAIKTLMFPNAPTSGWIIITNDGFDSTVNLMGEVQTISAVNNLAFTSLNLGGDRPSGSPPNEADMEVTDVIYSREVVDTTVLADLLNAITG